MITGTDNCGLRYAVRKGTSSVGWCALSIRCGTRDEEGYHSGIAHFTEHTIFKGTAHKSATVVNGYLDRLGGELNAYTTKEEIVIHATVLKEDLPKAAGLLFELATEATFPEKEIETEKGVVIDEIQSYKDSPADEVYDRFEEALYAGHPLGRPVLGTPASVRKITSEELRRFVKEHFTPDRMAFTMMADLDESRMEREIRKLARKYFGDAASGYSRSKSEAETETPPENCATLGNIRGGDPSLLGGGPKDFFEGEYPTQKFLQRFGFEVAEGGFAILGENVGNASLGFLHYVLVEVHDGNAEQRRELPPDAALAATHETGQRYDHARRA